MIPRHDQQVAEDAALSVPRGVVVVVVESDLAHRPHLRFPQPFRQAGVPRVGGDPGVVGVDAGGGGQTRVTAAQLQRPVHGAALRVGVADGEDEADAGGARPFQHGVAVGVEGVHLQMGVGVDEHQASPPSRRRTHRSQPVVTAAAAAW